MLEGGACALAPRNKKHRGRRIISLFMGSLLDRKDAWGIYCALHIPNSYVCQARRGGQDEAGRQDGQGDDNDSGGGVLQHVFDRSDLRATRGERSPDRGRGLGTREKAEERIASTVSLVAVVRR